jgi:hypothetical protein
MTSKTNFDNDETRLDLGNQSQNEQTETANEPVFENEPADKKQNSKNLGKRVAMGAAGVAAAGGVAYAASEMMDDSDAAATSGSQLDTSHFEGKDIPVAHNVTDSMSFNEAFATARHEVGAGGVFEWHGKAYNTFYAEEWKGLSDDYKQQFSNYAYDFDDNHSADAATNTATVEVSDDSHSDNIIFAEHVTINQGDGNENEVLIDYDTHDSVEVVDNDVTVVAAGSDVDVNMDTDIANVELDNSFNDMTDDGFGHCGGVDDFCC